MGVEWESCRPVECNGSLGQAHKCGEAPEDVELRNVNAKDCILSSVRFSSYTFLPRAIILISIALAVENVRASAFSLLANTTLFLSTISHFIIANACLFFVHVHLINCTVPMSAVKMKLFSMANRSRLTFGFSRISSPRSDAETTCLESLP